MYKTLFLLPSFFIFHLCSFAQARTEKIIYIVDSIPVIKDPEEGNEITQNDVSDITVITNKDSLKLLGFERFDKAMYLFTKEYRNRPENIKLIASTKLMDRKDGVWVLHETPYNGHFIDYYYSGKKQGDGTFLNGKLNDTRRMFYQNGQLGSEKIFKDGVQNGLEKDYYEDGSLQEKGEYVNGKEDGIWESFYPNGQVKLHDFYKNGELIDSAVTYYSSGRVKEKVFIKNGKVIPDPYLIKINQLLTKSNESYKEEDIKAAIKYCTKAIEIDSTYASAYFTRGTLKLNDFMFDDAIADFDKALKIEPFLETALANRAFARIRKFQFANSRPLSKNSEVTIMASKDKVQIPVDEQEKICNDLNKSVFLGNKSKMISEAIADYCHH